MGGAALVVAEKRESECRGSRWVRNLLGLHQGAMGIVQNLQPLPTLGLSYKQQVTEEQQAEGSEARAGGEEHTTPPTPQLGQLPLQFQAP